MLKIKSQNGSALFISLIMLLMLTVLGLTLMRGSILQEKMSGNAQSKNISFQDAESALRVAEKVAFEVELDEAYAFNGTGGKYQTNAAAPVWENANTTWAETTSAEATKGGANQPEYVVEFLDMVPREKSCAINLNDLQETCFVPMYRATGKGFGINEKVESTVQVTFKVLK